MASSGPADESPLKAIIFADACGGKSVPCRTTSYVQALQLHGCPILHWQLHVLSLSGVEDALVLSSSAITPPLPDRIRGMQVTTLSNPTWRSHGDALRDVESRVALRPTQDFVLVQPGALFNLSAKGLAKAHAARAAADRNWLVTITLRRGASATPLTVGMQSASSSLCHYSRNPPMDAVSLDSRGENVGLRDGGSVDIVVDVVDIGLDVCSPDFLVEFRENFDFDSVRDYVRAKLEGGEAELLGNRMYAHFVNSGNGEYATNVDSYTAYSLATRDIFDGWMTPFASHRVAGIADSGSLLLSDYAKGQTCISLLSAPDVSCPQVAQSARIADVVVGRGVKIADEAIVRRSVLGDGVSVGRGAVIEDSVLEAGVKVSSGAKLSSCLLSAGSSVAADVCIPPGCFLGENIVVGRGGGSAAGMLPDSWVDHRKALQKFVKGSITHDGGPDSADSDDDSDGVSSGESSDSSLGDTIEAAAASIDTRALGDGGRGCVLSGTRRFELYLRPLACGSDVGLCQGPGWPAAFGAVESDVEDELEGSDDEPMEGGDAVDDADAAPLSGVTDDNAADRAALTLFYSEMEETIKHAAGENADVDTIALEVNSLKLGSERSYADARVAVVRALVALILEQHSKTPAGKQWGAVSSALQSRKELIARFASGDTPEAQETLAVEVAEVLREEGRLCMYAMRALYDMDVLEEEAILAWATAEEKAVAGGRSAALLEATKQFIEWLQESEEESEEDSEEE